MNVRERTGAALRPAWLAALGDAYIGQESFVTAAAVMELARHAGVRAGVDVLDVCCGTGGPGRMLARRTGCRISGVDADPDAVAVARAHAAGLSAVYAVGSVPPLPPGRHDVVLLIETLLAFPDKPTLLAGVAGALWPGGRFACTVEVGAPLTTPERRAMPRADTVWPVTETGLDGMLADAGLVVDHVADVTAAHLTVVTALLREFAARRTAIAALLGAAAIDDLIVSHRLWAQWMASGRIRKLELVATRA